MAKNAAVCILFMMVMAYAVQQAESTIILKSLILGALLKKLFHKDKVPYVPPKPFVKPLPAPPKPVIIKQTARPISYPQPTRAYPVNARPYEGRRLMEATA